MAGFAPGFFGQQVAGNINVGLLFGLGQVVTTFVITMVYKSWADKRYDPAAAELAAEMERGEITGLAEADQTPAEQRPADREARDE